MIKIAIADDHKMFCAGIQSMLESESDIDIVKSFNDGKALLNHLKNNKIDIVILDINMPGINGIEASRFITENYRSTKIIILSMYKKPLIIQELLKIGIHSYILKDTDLKELMKAIRAVLENKKHYDPRVKEELMDYLSENNLHSQINLTSREKEIIKLIYQGNTSQEMANKLFISQYTVETHRKNLMFKTGAKNALELAKFYSDNELLFSK